MAIRINVTGIRDCPSVEVRAVMSDVIRPACAQGECGPVGDQLALHEHNGWTWFTTSVWGVSAGDLNRGLCRLARSAVQFSTSDGDRWYLTVHGGHGGQVHFLHEFAYHSYDPDPAGDADRRAELDSHGQPLPVDPRLAFLEDEAPPGSDRPKSPFDLIADYLTSLGVCIPNEFRVTAAELPYSQAVARYRRWHADSVVEALTAARIPHDPAAVRSVLLWENITDAESESDLGNLPRLLSTLGLGGEWDEWVRQSEAPPAPPEPLAEVVPVEPPAPPEDWIGPVMAITNPLGLTSVAGGAASLPLKEMPLIRFFAEALSINNIAGVVLTISLPAGFDWAALGALSDGATGSMEATPDGFRVGLPNHLWMGRRELHNSLGKKRTEVLFHLPDGAVLDVAFAQAGYPALTQRYRGHVTKAVWQIGETYPALSRDVLTEALDLARTAERSKHKARDEAEAKAVVELAKRDPHLWDVTIERKGRTVWCESDIVGHLPKVLFRHRFAAYWNVAAHDQEAARQYQQYVDMQRQIRRAGIEAARRRAAPHDDEVLWNGKCGRYWRSDLVRLTELEQETREKIDAALAGLGFQHIGDLVAKKQRDIVLRIYCSRDGLSHGVLMAKRTMYLGYEFFSRFADGSTLTTTTNGSAESQPDVSVYYKTYPGLEPAALYDKHRWGIERFRTKKGTEPVPLDPTLLGVVRELDRLFARRDGVSQWIRIVSTPPGEAPPEILAAWVGCVLPLFARSGDPRVSQQTKGVLSGKNEGPPEGLVVRVIDAVRELDRHNAQAAQWWREHASHLIQPGKLFVYPAAACELVDAAETPV